MDLHRKVTPAALVWRGVFVCAAYYLGSLLGYALLYPSSQISVVWPPNTVLLVALLLSAQRHWPWLLIVALPVHLLAQAQHGVLAIDASRYYAFNCALVLTTATATVRSGLNELTVRNLRQALIFLGVTTGATAVASFAWSLLIVRMWVGSDLWRSWYLVFLSNLLPFLIATPGLIIALRDGGTLVLGASPKRRAEFGLLALGLLGWGFAVFGLDPRAMGNLLVLLYAPLPFLLWAALRFGPGGLSFSFLIFAFMAVAHLTSGSGPFVTQSAQASAIWLQLFLLALYVPLFVLAAMIEERGGREESLRENEARYRAVVEDQTELICRFLPDGTYTFVNDAYCAYFHTSPDELLGRSFWTFIPPEGHQAAREFLDSISPDCPVATREHEVVAPGGELRWQQWRDRGFFDARGRVVEYQAVGRDITERKHAEEAMQSLAHVGRLALVGEMAGSIVHEVSQPLAAILVNATAAERQLQSGSASLDEVRTILADIRDNDGRALDVIKRMRALLRKRKLVMTVIDPNEVAMEVVQMVASEAHRRRTAVETVLNPALAGVRADRVYLQQVLLNLMLNGMEAMSATSEDRRRLVVRTESGGGQHVEVAVSDAGAGIPSDQLPRVFESFFTTKENGVGLGLAIARSIIELHGGRIWAENNAGGGATFHFTLPISAGTPGQFDEAADNDSSADLEQRDS
jgi:PAS domain S-box-containing protein